MSKLEEQTHYRRQCVWRIDKPNANTMPPGWPHSRDKHESTRGEATPAESIRRQASEMESGLHANHEKRSQEASYRHACHPPVRYVTPIYTVAVYV